MSLHFHKKHSQKSISRVFNWSSIIILLDAGICFATRKLQFKSFVAVPLNISRIGLILNYNSLTNVFQTTHSWVMLDLWVNVSQEFKKVVLKKSEVISVRTALQILCSYDKSDWSQNICDFSLTQVQAMWLQSTCLPA